MKFVTVIVAAVSSAIAVSGGPIQKREIGGVLLCTGPDATGHCEHHVYELNKCHQLTKPFYDNINTFAPDGEDFECFPRVGNCSDICRSPTGCTFGAVDFNYAHKFNLSAIGWDTLFGHFDCFLKRENDKAY